jgi:hypothetical protein
MQRAISTILSGVVLSTLMATSAIAADPKPSTVNMTVAEPQMVDLERAYIDKFGS